MIYNAGLDILRDVATADLRWALFKGTGYTFNKDHATVSALTPGSNEVSVSGYARVTLTGGTRTVDNSGDRVTYGCDNPDFGTLASGQNVTGVVLFKHVTSDSDSIPVAYYAIASTDTAVFDPFTVTLAGGMIATVAET